MTIISVVNERGMKSCGQQEPALRLIAADVRAFPFASWNYSFFFFFSKRFPERTPLSNSDDISYVMAPFIMTDLCV